MRPNLNPGDMAASGQVQSSESIPALPTSERMMTRFERQVIGMMVVAAILFVALTWRLFATI